MLGDVVVESMELDQRSKALNKILVVDDEQSIVESVKYNLEKEGYTVYTASDGKKALDTFNKEKPDLVILDLMLPGLSGEEVCRYIRKQSNIPIIMLTAKGDEVDVVVGLEIGADDYMTKPFSMRELIARVRAVLRRKTLDSVKDTEAEPNLIGPLQIDPKRHEIRFEGKQLDLTLKEYQILELLMQNQGQVLTREILLNRVWGEDYFGDTKTLDVHIRRLRTKVEKDPAHPEYIKTIRGVGYRLEAEE